MLISSLSNGQYIVAGSNDGSFFIWDRNTTNIVRVLRGDEKIVRCLQSHPSMCLLATCGMNPIIRLWSPLPEVNHFFFFIYCLYSKYTCNHIVIIKSKSSN